MATNIIGATVAVLCGFLVALVNYILSKTILAKAPEKFSFVTVVRQVIQIGFLAAVYFIGEKIPDVNIMYLLVGSVVGMTAPMVIFTRKLISFNQDINKKEPEKEGNVNG